MSLFKKLAAVERLSNALGIDFKGQVANIREGKRLFDLGVAAALREQFHEAFLLYSKSIEINQNPAPYLSRARILIKKIRYKEALDDLIEAQRIDQLEEKEFLSEIQNEINAVLPFVENYHNGMREKLISDFHLHNESNDLKHIVTRIFEASFDSRPGSVYPFDIPFSEYHFFNELNNIIQFEDIEIYPEAKYLLKLYTVDFITKKANESVNIDTYSRAENKLKYFFCSYDEPDMRRLRRLMLYYIHEDLLTRDYGEQLSFEDPRPEVIREAVHLIPTIEISPIGKEMVDKYGEWNIFVGVLGNDEDTVKKLEWLKAQGININVTDQNENTLMHLASSKNALSAMEWLNEQKLNINALNKLGHTSMHHAARENSVDAMKWLKTQGADINAQSQLGETPMQHAAKGNAVEALEWLKNQGVDINIQDYNGHTPFHDAARDNSVDALEWLNAHGADINAPDKYGQTPINYAAYGDAVKSLEWLKVHGANINVSDQNGQTPIHIASFRNSLNALEWLKAQNVDINALDNFGNTPMHIAASRDAVDGMKWLKFQGADINGRNIIGDTPMEVAILGNATNAIKWLKTQMDADDRKRTQLFHGFEKKDNSEELYQQGLVHLKSGKYDLVRSRFSEAMKFGHISAQWNLCLLLGSGSVSPYDFDTAADCWYQAAASGHERAKKTLWLIEAADRGGFGYNNLALMQLKHAGANIQLNHMMLSSQLMICAARFTHVSCQNRGATADVIAHELDGARLSDFPFVLNFIERTGIEKSFYQDGMKRLIKNSPADQITDGLMSFSFAMLESGVSREMVAMAKCSIVGYVIRKSIFGENAKPLRGIDTFFDTGSNSNDKVKKEQPMLDFC